MWFLRHHHVFDILRVVLFIIAYDLNMKVLQRINYKIIPSNLYLGYNDGSIIKQYHRIDVEGITTDQLQNNTSRIYVFIYMMTHKYEWIASCFICWWMWFEKEGIISDQYQNNTIWIRVFSPMTYAYKWMRYEVPYQIDSVLILRIPSIYNFLWITHRSFELLTDHPPCYSHNYIGNTQRRNKYND